MNKIAFHIVFLVFGFLPFSLCSAEAINIAVASNFRGPMESISKQFSEVTEHRLNVSYGSSGKLFAQIRHGAPYDIFLSADQDKPTRLVETNSAKPGNQFTYATGTLVLWSRDDRLLPEEGFTRIGKDNVKKIAIANPKLAPFGKAALEAIQRLEDYDNIAAKLVYGENVSQAFQFAFSGNAEYGLVSLSQVYVNSDTQNGYVWEVPQIMHGEIYQDAVLLKRGESKLGANEFMTYLQSEQVKDILQRFGYKPSRTKTN